MANALVGPRACCESWFDHILHSCPNDKNNDLGGLLRGNEERQSENKLTGEEGSIEERMVLIDGTEVNGSTARRENGDQTCTANRK